MDSQAPDVKVAEITWNMLSKPIADKRTANVSILATMYDLGTILHNFTILLYLSYIYYIYFIFLDTHTHTPVRTNTHTRTHTHAHVHARTRTHTHTLVMVLYHYLISYFV